MNEKEIIELALSSGFTDFQVKVVASETLTLSIYESNVDETKKSRSKTLFLKGIYNGNGVDIFLEDLTPENIKKQLLTLLENARQITIKEPAMIYEGSSKYETTTADGFDFSKVSLPIKIELLEELERKATETSILSRVTALKYSDFLTTTSIVNSKGLDITKSAAYSYVYIVALFGEGEEKESHMKFQMVKSFDDYQGDEFIKDFVEKGAAKVGGTTTKSKSCPVVLSSEVFSEMISSFSPIFSAESSIRHLTKLTNKIGEKIASSVFSLSDSPMHKLSIIKNPFDDEGVASIETQIIEKGIFKGFLNDLKTAEILKTKLTGNSFNGSISPTVISVSPGSDTLKQLLKKAADGVYITNVIGTHAGVQTVSGDFSLQASGFEIKNGQLSRPVKMIVVSGNFYELLLNIDGLGVDLFLDSDGNIVPDVLIKHLTIGGN